ncbi:MocR-like pyridoxine biosynthesis transcription factor PdxR [Brevibacillus migulae]|uniref:MocR-like pyridoxine biosynthesis transcription factor PdxR n=1 Tax=Brevibacillus migulae TaxID=1644114 RepID=UPI00106ED0BA|nr:PLP-dependent aminotransferase family protein [Brevibacillus migulae]
MIQIDWKPDKSLATPVYIQIKDFIKEKIETGQWTVGTRIPAQRALAQLFGVNRSTVVLACEELIAEGLLEGKSGQGTRVKNNTWSLLSSAPPPDWNQYIKRGAHQPNLPTIQDINRWEPLPHIIRLGTGEPSPEIFPQELMAQILHRLPAKIQSLGYEEGKGLYPLREELSKHLQSIGIAASPSSIMIVSGALQALQLISIGLLRRNSTILLEKPSYLKSLNLFPSSGINMVGIPMDEYGIQIPFVKQQKKKHNASLLYTIPSFHNPTGTVMSLERRKQLLQACEEGQLPIIEDDVYRELWLDEPPPPPLKAMDKHGTVLYLGSISKALAPGLRIGWVAGPEPVIDRLADIKMQTDYGSSSLSQWAVAEWLASGMYDVHLANMRDGLRLRRDTMLALLADEFAGIAEWTKPSGGFYIWLQLPAAVSLRELFEAALQEGILLNPGNLYDSLAVSHLRLSYSYASLPDMEKGIKKLAEIVRHMVK